MEQSFDKILRPLNSLRLGFILGMLGLIPNFLILGTQQWRMLLLLLLFHVLGTTLIVLCSEIIYHYASARRYGIMLLSVVLALMLGIANVHMQTYYIRAITPILEDYQRMWASYTMNLYDSLPNDLRILMELLRAGFTLGLIYYIVYSQRGREQHHAAEKEVEKLRQENFDTQLRLLRQQISPHFLFNALSTLRSITSENKTKNFVTQLSNVYRYLLSRKERNLVTLREEMDFTESYLYILKERFEDGLQIDISIDRPLLDSCLPPLALQILIENATKHNIVSFEEPLNVSICNEGPDWLVVSNNLQPKLSHTESFGIGLQNIRKRYRLLGERNIDIQQTDKSFSVRIPLLPQE
ncbi:MAG: histidine kinase [Paludibacteraceae bacterium]|nr:histidine kinase [Paludibacteraceae bacterium]